MDTYKMSKKDRKDMIQYINLQLAALGQPLFSKAIDDQLKSSNARLISLTENLIKSFREKSRLLSEHQSPSDKRIQNFIADYLNDLEFPKSLKIPTNTFVLNQPGLARELSLPPNGNTFKNEYLTSFRLNRGF